MRLFTNHSATADAQKTMPFTGLGFDADGVRTVAQLMVPTHPRCHPDSSGTFTPIHRPAAQSSGYELLVSLGREIRGR